MKGPWSNEINRFVSCEEEAEVYLKAGLLEANIGGKPALIRQDIDWADYSIKRNTWLRGRLSDYDEWAKYNNADLIGEGYPPRDPNGDPYELHHIGQRQDSPFAELTWAEHMGDGNNSILHKYGKEADSDRETFEKEKAEYWRARCNSFRKSEIRIIYKS